MPTAIPYLHIQEELPSKLTLVSANRRWLILIGSLVFVLPMVLIGTLLTLEEEIWMVGVAALATGLLILALILLYTPFKSQLTVDSTTRKVTLIRHYWLGFGGTGRNREKSWSLDDFTDANLVSQGWNKVVELEANGKKGLLLLFGRKAMDAQRSYDLIQTWLKGLAPDSNEAKTTLQELASEKQNQGALKNAEKMLNYFGVFSLISGGLGVYTDITLASEVSIASMLNIFTGLIYLACGYGVKHRSEIALWIAILVVVAERGYWFILSGSLSGDGNWGSWLTWVFAFFVVTSLWKAIQSVRTMEESPAYEPLP